MGDAIFAEDLSKSYGRTRGIVDLSFAVRPGEVFGYLGPNGAGKTTTIRTLLDLIRPTSGHATILGLDVRRDREAVHRRTGYVPGEFGLDERMTGREFLTYFASLRGGVDERLVRDLLERLDLDPSVRVRSLSHGNRRKLALIQAFMHEPDLVVLDEPTQGLDPLIQREFYAIVDEVRRDGRTAFVSSHVLPEIDRICDRVGIIRDGRLTAVEDVGVLKARAIRMVTFHFATPVDPGVFAALPNVRDVTAHGDEVHLTVAGPVDAVLEAAAAHEVVDVVSHEPSLEDIFLAFYGGESDGDTR
jgi:beta-exotoxin I transport system ATP-binding protein